MIALSRPRPDLLMVYVKNCREWFGGRLGRRRSISSTGLLYPSGELWGGITTYMIVWIKVDRVFLAGVFLKLRIVKVILKIPLSTAWLQLSGDNKHNCGEEGVADVRCKLMLIAVVDI